MKRVSCAVAALCGCLLAAATVRSADAPDRQVIRRHFDPADREAGRYQYVPFDVAEGTTRLTVEYRYDRAGDATIIDLGLFEPGPLDLVTAHCRGWSGSERASVTVAPGFATPGYWPGPIQAGRWNLQLGLYKVAPAGVDVTVMVEALRDLATRCAAPAPPAAQTPIGGGPKWYAGGLHLHTVHSDGTVTAAELARRARAAGLDFIAITDHNNTAHQVEVFDDGPPLRIVGEEVTTPAGHANVWGLGLGDWIDFRALPGDGRIERIVRSAVDRGAVVSINHPRVACAGCSWEHAIPDGIGAIEIWNRAIGPQEDAIAIWDGLLRQGRRVTAVGVSDWHGPPAPIDSAAVRVFARELSPPAILEAIRAGRVVVVRDATTAPPVFTATAGGPSAGVGETLAVASGQPVAFELSAPGLAGGRAELRWNGERTGSAAIGPDERARFTQPASAGYAWVQVFAADGAPVAVTNPIYVALR